MIEQDLVTPLFVEDASVSPQFTKWFPSWVWWGRDGDGKRLACEWAIARWKVTTGAMQIALSNGMVQVGDTTHKVEREFWKMTPGNILRTDLAIDCCLVPKEGDIS